MTSFDPTELSALLDGELPAERARAIEAMLASDPDMRAQFEALRRADDAFRGAAHSAGFAPSIHLPPTNFDYGAAFGAAAFVLVPLTAWTASKLLDGLALGLIVHGLALALVLLSVVLIVGLERPAVRT